MSKATDASLLRNIQYRDSQKLAARTALHDLFSTNPVGWQDWVISHLDIPSRARILEIGCGPGFLWQGAEQALPTGSRVILTDLSLGMIKEARAALADRSPFSFAAADAAVLPFQDCLFDLVVANHMLYHLPSVPTALKEIHRVLKPSGCLYAATNGSRHLWEIHSWETQVLDRSAPTRWGTATRNFNLENGTGLLSACFTDIKLIPCPDRLLVTEVEPLIRYIASYHEGMAEPQARNKLERFLQNELSDKGVIEVTKETGMFIASKR